MSDELVNKLQESVRELKEAGLELVRGLLQIKYSHPQFGYDDQIKAMLEAMRINEMTGEKEDAQKEIVI